VNAEHAREKENFGKINSFCRHPPLYTTTDKEEGILFFGTIRDGKKKVHQSTFDKKKGEILLPEERTMAGDSGCPYFIIEDD